MIKVRLAFLLLSAILLSCSSTGNPRSEPSENQDPPDSPPEEETPEGGTSVGSLQAVWLGTLQAGGQSLRIVFRISTDGNGWSAVLDSPDQGVSGIPAESVSVEDRSIRIEVPSAAAVFEGEIGEDGDRITGAWKQGGGSYPLTLEPVEEVKQVRRPQDPEPPFPYRVEEVLFSSGDITLAGTLTLPEGAGPHAAVVLISGSGAQNRDEEVFNHRPFLVIADGLTRRGFAVLRYDDRGVGGSGGDAATADSRDLADDAWSGASLLLDRRDISSVGLVGHSEGGMIAPIVAVEHPQIAFIVLLAGPGLPGDELLALQNRTLLAAAGAGKDQIDVIDEINRKIYAAVKNEPETAAETVRGLLESLGMEESRIEAQVGSLLSPWMRFFLAYDPRTALREVSCPVLALNGGLDLQVPAEENLTAIRAALEKGKNPAHLVKRLPGLNHLFQHAGTGMLAEYAAIDETFAPEALGLMIDWMTGVIDP